MAKLEALLAELLAGEGVVVPDGFSDSVMGAYNEDIEASNAEMNTIIGARDERIRELMAQAAIDTIPEEDKDPYEEEEDDGYSNVSDDFGEFFGTEGEEDTDEDDEDDEDDKL